MVTVEHYSIVLVSFSRVARSMREQIQVADVDTIQEHAEQRDRANQEELVQRIARYGFAPLVFHRDIDR